MRAITLVPLLAALGLAAAAPEPGDSCHVGVYRLRDGRVVDIAPMTETTLRWRLMDGRTGRLDETRPGLWTSLAGWTGQPDGSQVGFGTCEEGRITFEGQAGRRVPLVVQETRFEGAGGVSLAGRLVLPAGTGRVPVSVLVHGSESTSGRRFYFDQRAWPANGVGVFVYDKRGTGGSEGKYTQDFKVLAEDAAAAAREARRLGGRRVARLGFDGGSQGGWIAPLAATLVPADYVIARYGMAESPLAEDNAEVLLGLKEKGYGPEVLTKAAEVADAAGRLVASRFQSGWEEVRAVKARYEAEPWFKDLDGEFTGSIVKAPEAAVRVIGPQRDLGTSWDYDPMPVLRSLKAPMLWVLAGADREAPVDETRRRLLSLAREGRPVTVLEFPGTDHGIREFEPDGKGGRRYTRYADGYYRAVLDFSLKGRVSGRYGNAQQLAP
jgi:uncharacterized protein